MALIMMGYFEWIAQFRPITKVGTGHIAFDTHDDTEFLRSQPDDKIWTLVHCDESNDCVIVNGFQWVNRLEHYVSEVAHDLRAEYNVD